MLESDCAAFAYLFLEQLLARVQQMPVSRDINLDDHSKRETLRRVQEELCVTRGLAGGLQLSEESSRYRVGKQARHASAATMMSSI